MNRHVTAWVRARMLDPWVADTLVVGSGLALTALAVKTPWSPLPLAVIAGAGALGSAALVLRGRWPATITVVGAAAYALSGNPWPFAVALFTATATKATGAWTAQRRALVVLALVGGLGFVAPDWIESGRLGWSAIEAAVLGTALVMGAGGYVATRRELVSSLRERAERAEAARLLRDEQARAGERTRIAREMHDVLAHKVALISLHAGGLEVNAHAEPSRIGQGAALIRATAQEALEELRGILGVLRAHETPDLGTEPFADLHRLVDSWRRAGAAVELHDEVGDLPAATARAAYRLVQEGLTNAHKHAPGAPVTVSVTGGGGQPVTVVVGNAAAREAPRVRLAGAGVGLVGLAERLRLIGGTLRSEARADGGWRLEGRLPWVAGFGDQRTVEAAR